MTRDQLEHLLRASARSAADPDVIVFGSQAILGSFDDADRAHLGAWIDARS